MKLIELELRYFKSITQLLMHFDGRDAYIIGDNEKGKTTIVDAFIWLLSGKDHLGRTDYQIKTLDEDNKAIPGLDHTVRAIIEHRGAIIELERTYREVWTKKKGSTEETFTGHETVFFINKSPKNATEYKAFIERLVPLDLLYILIIPNYFCELLDMKERRRALLDRFGDVDDAEILARKEFSELASMVNEFMSVSDLKAQKTSEKTRINKRLAEIPIEIKTNSQYLPPEGLTAEEEQRSINDLSEQIFAKMAEKQALYSGEGIAKLRRELTELEQQKTQAKTAAQNKRNELKTAIRAKITKAERARADVVAERNQTQIKRSALISAIDSLKSKKEDLLTEYDELFASEFSIDTVCPTCGQSIPEEKIEDARAQFNENKALSLESNVEKGKEIAAVIEAKQFELNKIEEHIQLLSSKISDYDEKIKELEDEFDSAGANIKADFDENLITSKQAEIENFNASIDDRAAEIQDAINALTALKSQHEQNLSAIKIAKEAADKIEALKEEEKRLSKEYGDCERIINLCDSFTNTKVKLLDEKISGKFRLVKWKLTETQINGGLKEICEPLIGGVPYSAANNAAQINAGLDIIETFAAQAGIVMPIFIDNAESVTAINPMDRFEERPQIIQTIVPLAWDKLGSVAREALLKQYKTEAAAKAAYEAPGKKLRLEIL